MQKTLYIPIDVTIDDTVECQKKIKRGDTLLLTIKVFNNGVLADLTNQSIDLILKKSDGTLIQTEIDLANIANGVVTAKLDVQATVIEGIVSGELQLNDTAGQSSTNTFTFNVDPSLADDVLEVSKNEIQVLADLKNTISDGNTKISQYEENILSIGNSIESIEALVNVKSYIDTNLTALQNNNASAVINNANLKEQNDKAPGLTNNLKTENDKAPQLTTNLKTENDKADINIPALTTANNTAEELKNTLEADITNANNSKIALDTSKTDADNSKIALDQSVNNANTFVSEHGDIIDLDNRVTENTNSIDSINTSLSEKVSKSEKYKITRPTKGTFDTATVVNINNTGKQAEVSGFRREEELATYADRDSVVAYLDSEAPQCTRLAVVSFTATSVTVTGDTSLIENGMIIDCMNQSELVPFNQATKYSGFVTNVDGQIINVGGWYQLGNTSSGQIPNKDTIIINPVTKIWGMNANVFLNQDSFGWGGVVAEYGMFNRKSAIDSNCKLGGIDMIAYDGRCEFAFKARKTSGNLENGYISDSATTNFSAKNGTTGYKSSNATENYKAIGKKGFVAENTEIAFMTDNENFKVDGIGVIKNISPKYLVYSSPSAINPRNAFFHFLNSTGIFTLPDPSYYVQVWIKIFALFDATVNGKMYTNTGAITSKSVTARRQLELFSDGVDWHVIF